jgi:hypothetical protein
LEICVRANTELACIGERLVHEMLLRSARMIRIARDRPVSEHT